MASPASAAPPFPKYPHLLLPLSTPRHHLPLRHHQNDASTPPTTTTAPSSLRRLRDPRLARAHHALLSKSGALDDTHLFNSLLSAYAHLCPLSETVTLFHAMPSPPDVASYSVLVSAYAKADRAADAADLFERMRRSGVAVNSFVLVAALTASVRCRDHRLASQVHALATKTGLDSRVHVSNAVMAAHAKCGLFEDMKNMFDGMRERDVASYNTVISALASEARYETAFSLFDEMQFVGLCADPFTLSSLLSAAATDNSDAAESLHAHAVKTGLDEDLSVANALIGFYSRSGCVDGVVDLFNRMPVMDAFSWAGLVAVHMESGSVESAIDAFDRAPEKNCVSRNALLRGFVKNGEGLRALEMFHRIVEDGSEISDFTLTIVAGACSLYADKRTSEQVHAFATKVSAFGTDSHVDAALLDMCARCGRIDDARAMFSMWAHDEGRSIVWTSLATAYARDGLPEEALSGFLTMWASEEDVSADEVAVSAALGVCGTLGCEEIGRQIHGQAIKSGVFANVGAGNAVLGMYSKCFNVEDTIKAFNSMTQRDVVSWNTLIGALVLHRRGDDAMCAWGRMEKAGVSADEITCDSIISAFKHASRKSIDACGRLFSSMQSHYGIEPDSSHYGSYIRALAHLNRFKEAEELIERAPCEPDISVWRALLGSPRLGVRAAQRILAMEPRDARAHVLVANLYAASGRWQCSERAREEMRLKGLRKRPVRSWTVVRGAVHAFYARDRAHELARDVYGGLDVLIKECVRAGYEPDTGFVLHEAEEYQKRDFLYYHSAKLALACGVLYGPPGRPVRVVKNVRVCGDCHAFFGCVSAVTGRVVLLRDSTGVHCFEGGQCSCGGCW
ncbi:Pentatricopeptide repeat-containing protein [Acorus gramineus]|uniref:Pentatricopeptide repeat-containing protein n=1 Tax=Acorus gramineus TaxID=55184 RepID=A0AAV9AIB1_ACOGR|nr:Pentatricopeptide repeat-containing protein [Acorus gramineus]